MRLSKFEAAKVTSDGVWQEDSGRIDGKKGLSYWCHLAVGLCVSDNDGQHTIHEDTTADVRRELRNARKCWCADCTKEKAASLG